MQQNICETGQLGELELFRAIPGFSRHLVSDRGRVRHVRTGNIRTGYDTGAMLGVSLMSDDGYMTTRNMGALMLLAFVGPRPDGFDTSHLDGDYTHNHLHNLVWESRVDNMRRRGEHGNHFTMPGMEHTNAKLTDQQVQEVRRRLAEKVPQRAVAAEYGVSQALVSNIATGRAWAHLV